MGRFLPRPSLPRWGNNSIIMVYEEYKRD